MSIYTAPVSELQDLVEKPIEREWLELKSWVDLTDAAARANTARHLAAISNYGGGYLVFGFNKDGTRCPRKDNVKGLYSHDVLAGIINKYLTLASSARCPSRSSKGSSMRWPGYRRTE